MGRGRPGRLPVELALRAVRNFEHRGGCMPDGTADGTGFLLDIPRAFLARELSRAVPGLDTAFLQGPAFGAITMILPRDAQVASIEQFMRSVLASAGIELAGTRDVPLRPESLGTRAAATAPRMLQIVFRWKPPFGRAEAARHLYMAQRRLESALREAGLPAYLASFSDRTLVYKAMADGTQFAGLFPDLRDPEFLVGTVVFHRRFATNTVPDWKLCQPFRMLCHNGEINTIAGNRNAVRMWEQYLLAAGKGKDWAGTTLVPGQSDSGDLDRAAQAYHAEGRSLAYTLAILMPPAWENQLRGPLPEMKAFFEYHKRAMAGLGAWEGPAAIIAYDGDEVVASLDRMGLRPLRVMQNRQGVFLASSENGVFGHPPQEIVYRAQLPPGAIVKFDTEARRLVSSADVYFDILRETAPRLRMTYREANHSQVRTPSRYGAHDELPHPDLEAFRGRVGAFLRAWGWDSKLRQGSTDHLVDVGKEDIYSLGFDRALPALSVDAPTLYRYFLQRFALVTNPPIDPYREGRDMSLVTYLGAMPDVPPRTSVPEPNLRLKSPFLTGRTVVEILSAGDLPSSVLSLTFPAEGDGSALRGALTALVEEAVDAVRSGSRILVLSDLGCFARALWPMPAPLAVASIHDRLVQEGLRPKCSIVVQSGEIAEGHDAAVLLALGANALHPHALFQYAIERSRSTARNSAAGVRNVKEGLEESLRKILSKMGIATVQGYVDSCLFEVVGLGPDVASWLPRVPSRVGGLDMHAVAADIRNRVRHARVIDELPALDNDDRGYADALRVAIWKVACTGSNDDWRELSRAAARRRPCSLRDLLEVIPKEQGGPVLPPPAETVLRDCVVTGGMSHGALTARAHEAIAIAANRIGMLSNSGEGGEDRARNRNGEKSTARSRIRQVATGRFGVDAEYLVNADEIQIKMAQGAKPGEGGQLMAAKVTAEIARLRYCRPGIDLISPPPHHDIYSIEDLKQLVYDLRAVNPDARISVKLCAVTGIGTIAAGVVKAGAELIEIDGLEGGTGASPRPSIEHAGLPTELGLREVHLALSALGLRHLVLLRAGGGIRTEHDALKYILLGADQITIATSLMIAQGCVHCNSCHTGHCPTFIAGEKNPRAVYPGSPAHVERYLRAFGAAIARLTAQLGAHHPKELVGRSDLLRPLTGKQVLDRLSPAYGLDREALADRCARVDLSVLLSLPPESVDQAESTGGIDNLDHTTGRLVEADDQLAEAAAAGVPLERSYELDSCASVDFSVSVASRIARSWGRDRWPSAESICLSTEGTAGQSYGAFCVHGMRLTHVGACNDGVAKGMSGGKLVVLQPKGFSGFPWQTTLVGNNVAFGATGGTLFIQGRAGQRLGVRNSGAIIVCEGADQYACEYMTAGVVVILGPVGEAIGAGMTDGRIYLYDPDSGPDIRFTIDDKSVALTIPAEDEIHGELAPLLHEYLRETGSARAKEALENLYEFHKIVPIATVAAELRRKLAIDVGVTIAG